MNPHITAPQLASIIMGAAVLGGALTAQAGESVDSNDYRTRSITVQYGDLNLSKPDGIDTLYQRLRTAAGKVCGPGKYHRSERVRAAWHQCHDSALDDAVAAVGLPSLVGYHFEQTGRDVEISSKVATTQ